MIYCRGISALARGLALALFRLLALALREWRLPPPPKILWKKPSLRSLSTPGSCGLRFDSLRWTPPVCSTGATAEGGATPRPLRSP